MNDRTVMPECDRCGSGVPVSTTELADVDELTHNELRKLQEPSDEPFTIIEGAFAVWTAELDIEKRGRFPLLFCRDCTQSFVDWLDVAAVTPEGTGDYDFDIEWSYVDE
jgi:hypothetical protein